MNRGTLSEVKGPSFLAMVVYYRVHKVLRLSEKFLSSFFCFFSYLSMHVHTTVSHSPG